MSDQDIQNIIAEARASRNAPTVTIIEEPEEVTIAPQIETPQSLDEDQTEDIISEMLGAQPVEEPIEAGLGLQYEQPTEEQLNTDADFVNPEDLYPEEVTLNDTQVNTSALEERRQELNRLMSEVDDEDLHGDTDGSGGEGTEGDPIPESQEETQSQDPREQMIPNPDDDPEHRESTSRFNGAEWFEVASKMIITFAGLGGIGSWAAFLLARIHPEKILLYDSDTVELVNMSGQLYSSDDAFNTKADAISRFMRSHADYYDTESFPTRFDASCHPTKIMISGFDNMAARKMYFTSWRTLIESLPKRVRRECLYIDARMSAEEIQIYCMTGDNESFMDEYRDTCLFRDEDADAHICSYKQTSFCAALIGGLISNLFVNFCTNLGKPLVDRPLPFLTTYDASTMFLNVRN